MAKTLIVLTGPTGIGKTDLSIKIATHFNTEIISCDSRQIYKEMKIGTAVPEQIYLETIPHHFIQTLSVKDYYNASKFEFDVLEKLKTLFNTKEQVIMTGGSMMYIDAVCRGIDDLPTVDPQLRKQLLDQYEAEGLENIRMQLKKVDPEYYNKVDLKNPKRILHALEIFFMTGKPYSSLRTNKRKKRDFDIIKIGLNRDRAELYDRINRRVDIMVENGLIEEARSLHRYKDLNTLNTVGYRELFSYFDGEISYEEAIEKIKANSRKYARKQLTWFRRDEDMNWFHPDESEKIIEFLDNSIKRSN
jgi:tRNA dimethylallyltransferase